MIRYLIFDRKVDFYWEPVEVVYEKDGKIWGYTDEHGIQEFPVKSIWEVTFGHLHVPEGVRTRRHSPIMEAEDNEHPKELIEKHRVKTTNRK